MAATSPRPDHAGNPQLSEQLQPGEYFRHGRFRVTEDIVRARTKSIQLSTIEGVEVHRPLFFLAMAGCAGLAGLSLVFGDLLYFSEIVFFLALAGGLILLAWNVGSLRVFSKLTREKGWAVIWWIKPLHRMREAIEAAMEDRARGRSRRVEPPPPPAPSARPSPAAHTPPPEDMDATIQLPRPPRR